MAESDKASRTPTEIKLHQKSRTLEIAFGDGSRYQLPCELLRVYSPSAEVRGHGPGQEVLQVGKINAEITGIEPVGTYAINLAFADGHNSGIYSWDFLFDLATNQESLWARYLERMKEAGASREPVSPMPGAFENRPKSK